MVDYVFKERNIGFHAANAEFTQRAIHALAGFGKCDAPRRHFHQQRIVVRRKCRTGVSRAAIETNAEACW